MAPRFDSTAIWYEQGENPETMADTLAVADQEEEPPRRRVPTLAWIFAGVVGALVLFCEVLTHVAHASRVTEPAALPSLAIGTGPGTQPAPTVSALMAATITAPAASAPAASSVATSAPTSRTASTAPTTAGAAKPATASLLAPVKSTATRRQSATATRSRLARAQRPAPEVLAGENLLRRGRAAPALAKFQQQIARSPDDARALRGACLSLAQLGRLNEAARVCRRALDRAPEDLTTRRALATIYYNGGAYKWSATEWRHVVEQAPKDVHARRALRAAEARS